MLKVAKIMSLNIVTKRLSDNLKKINEYYKLERQKRIKEKEREEKTNKGVDEKQQINLWANKIGAKFGQNSGPNRFTLHYTTDARCI